MPAPQTEPSEQDSSGRRLVSSGAAWETIVGYSRAVRVGHLVWVAGTTAPGVTAAEQTRAALARIAEALKEVGADLTDVVRTRMFVTDIALWEEVGAEHSRVFGEVRPASSMVEVAALVEPGLLVEIEADAYVTSDRR